MIPKAVSKGEAAREVLREASREAARKTAPVEVLGQTGKKVRIGIRKFIGLCKTNETKNLQKRQALPARAPPNKFEGATLGFY